MIDDNGAYMGNICDMADMVVTDHQQARRPQFEMMVETRAHKPQRI